MDECELIAEIFKALSHPTRLRILKILKNGKCNIAEIAEKFSISQSSVSQHLKILENAGVVSKVKEGNIVFCDLKYELILKLFDDAKQIVYEELKNAHEKINNA